LTKDIGDALIAPMKDEIDTMMNNNTQAYGRFYWWWRFSSLPTG
jgi:hypothetical protein